MIWNPIKLELAYESRYGQDYTRTHFNISNKRLTGEAIMNIVDRLRQTIVSIIPWEALISLSLIGCKSNQASRSRMLENRASTYSYSSTIFTHYSFQKKDDSAIFMCLVPNCEYKTAAIQSGDPHKEDKHWNTGRQSRRNNDESKPMKTTLRYVFTFKQTSSRENCLCMYAWSSIRDFGAERIVGGQGPPVSHD